MYNISTDELYRRPNFPYLCYLVKTFVACQSFLYFWASFSASKIQLTLSKAILLGGSGSNLR
jgi:hypothetical protein